MYTDHCVNFFCRSHVLYDSGDMIIRALPFDNVLFHGKIKRDHIVFIPTWCDKVPHTLDFQNEEDRKRLSYGSVVLFFKTYLSVDKNGVRQEHDLAFVEELWPWETVPGKGDVLGSEFHCRRLYGAAPKRIYQVIDTWRILGSAPVIRDPCRPTIPPGTLPKDSHTRKTLYRYAKEDSSLSQKDGSALYIVNWWAMKWGSQDLTQGDSCS
jgi:hypothetical protein